MSRQAEATSILKTYALASGGAGLVTAPFLGMAAITALHLSLIRDLSGLYEVEFSKDTARGTLLALGAAFVPGWLGFGIQRSILEKLPLMTGGVGWLVSAGFSAAVTYGLGKTLIDHFESGGTLENFDVSQMHSAIRHVFAQARSIAHDKLIG